MRTQHKVPKLFRAQHPLFKADAENISPLETGTTTPKILPNGWFSRRVPLLPQRLPVKRLRSHLSAFVVCCSNLLWSCRDCLLSGYRAGRHREHRPPKLTPLLLGGLITGWITSVYQHSTPGGLF